MKHIVSFILLLVMISCNSQQKQPKKPVTYSISFRPPTKKESRMIGQSWSWPKYEVEDIFAEHPTKYKGKYVNDSNGHCCVLVPLDKRDSIELGLKSEEAIFETLKKGRSDTTIFNSYIAHPSFIYTSHGVDTLPAYFDKLKKLSKEIVDSAYLKNHPNITIAQQNINDFIFGGDWPDTSTLTFSTSIGKGYAPLFIAEEEELDTVPVIMLCSDTVLDRATSTMGFFYELDKAKNDGRIPFWMKGYSVREKHNTAEGVVDLGFSINTHYCDYWQHLYFLDEYKHPLSKRILVWQSH